MSRLALAPLSEEPINEQDSANCSKKGLSWKIWLKTHLSLAFNKKLDLKTLLSVLGCPLFPVSVLSKSPINEGLDPMAISAVFSSAQYMGEKRISGTDCFVLKLSADQVDLADRSDNTAEMIKHVIFGYFSQRSGLLVFLEDSYLTRIQSPGTHPTYWETTMATKIEDYRLVEGVMVAHSGQSNVIITRFGDNLKAGLSVTHMEEIWTVEDVAFNVHGLSLDCFIPPKEVQRDFPDENLDWRSPWHR
ncbi:Boundary of ROP domain1 [Hibiscus trionum]|uniref:Boundary of ROP domain1 n=1 Tax=Hibiscus trionum TaxID=183268 RepID=A0A9W7H4Z1_HIBTR|nr:Boundary of ROP domain1 [Hibiscus trionum]